MIKLDNKTQSLLIEIEKQFDIKFKKHNKDYCEVFLKEKNATIYYNSNYNNDSIAHELLHLWLKQFNYCIGNRIFHVFEINQKLSKIFDKYLCDFIENFCDHYKMYPKYIEMGYSPENFLLNGTAMKSKINDLEKLKLSAFNIYNAKAINFYIGSLLSIYADHITHDYSKHLIILKELDHELFNIITEFWNKWVEFDISKNDNLYNSDRDITDYLIDAMIEWSENKQII